MQRSIGYLVLVMSKDVFDLKLLKEQSVVQKLFYDKSLKNIDEYILAIRMIYRLAVDFNDSRCSGGIVKQENTDSSYGSFGIYYNFVEMPLDIWWDVEKEVKEFIQNS